MGVSGRKSFELGNGIERISVELAFPIFTIKLYGIHMASDSREDFSKVQVQALDLQLQVKAVNTHNGHTKFDRISLFTPNFVNGKSAVIEIDRTFPIENVGISRKADLPYDRLEFSLINAENVPESLVFSLEFDSRPGGFDNLASYRLEIIETRMDEVNREAEDGSSV